MEETSAVSQTQTDVLVDDGTANASPLNNAVAEMCSSEPSASSFINLNLKEHDEGLKTLAGNSIKRLLGCDDDLVKFDDFRFELKNAKRAGGHIHKTSISEYREMVGKFKTKVKFVQSERADKLKEMEHKQFQLTGKLPAKTPLQHSQREKPGHVLYVEEWMIMDLSIRNTYVIVLRKRYILTQKMKNELLTLFCGKFIGEQNEPGPKVARAKLLMAVFDLPAKAMASKFFQYNGYYSCIYCLDKGVHGANRHTFLTTESHQPRTKALVQLHAAEAEHTG